MAKINFSTETEGYEQLAYFCLVKIFRAVFNFYVQGSFHVALSAVALTWLTSFSFGYGVSKILLCFIFTATVVGYNFLQYGSLNQGGQNSSPQNLRFIKLFSLMAFLAMGWFFLQLPFPVWAWVVLCGLLTLFYAVPAVPGAKNLRNVSGLKIAIITVVWAMVTVVLPMVYFGIGFGKTAMLFLLQRFLFLWVLVLPFEIRDLKNDALSLGTIPQRIGAQNTKVLGCVLLFVTAILEYWLQTLLPNPLRFTYVVLGITTVFLLFSTPERPKGFTAFWVEAIPVVWFLLELIY